METGMYPFSLPHGIMFHHFYGKGHTPGGQGALSAEAFDKLLRFIGIDRVLPPEEWLHKVRHNRLRAGDLCITFDDGLKCQYDICVPILAKYNLRCFWFVYSSVHQGALAKFELYRCFRSRYFDTVDGFFELFFEKHRTGSFRNLDDDGFASYCKQKQLQYPFYSVSDLRYRYIRDVLLDDSDFERLMDALMEEKGVTPAELALDLWLTDSHLIDLCEKGHAIGLHSYNHPTTFSKLSYLEQARQYERNYRHIRETCSVTPTSMAHPNNSYNADTLKILTKLNIHCGFRSNMVSLDRDTGSFSFLQIPRMDHSNIVKIINSQSDRP